MLKTINIVIGGGEKTEVISRKTN